MAKLSAKDIAGFAVGAGFPESAVATAVAVALAESSGRTDARGDVALQNATWGPSIGLWQIRSLTAERGTGKTRDETRLAEPAFNAASAYAIWTAAGGTFSKDWTAYRSRAYLLFMPAGQLGASQNAGRALTAASVPRQDNPLVPDAVERVADLAVFPAKAAFWLKDRNNIVRVVKVAIGAGLVMAGLYVVARPVTRQVQDTAKAVIGVAGAARGGGGKAAPKAAPKPEAPTGAS